MKKLTSTILFACCAAFISCGNRSNNGSAETTDSVSETTMMDQTDATANTAMGADENFAMEAANGGMAEVALGELAQEKSKSVKVKEFATMMVTDHGKANAELKALASAKNISLPVEPNADKQKIKEELSAKSGDDFDKAYVAEMVKDHQKDIALFEEAKNKVEDTEMKQFIEKTLPVLKKHMEHIDAISKQSM